MEFGISHARWERRGERSLLARGSSGVRKPLVEQAAAAAIVRHISSAKAVRAIADQLLAYAIARLDAESPPPLTQQHELIREPSEYAGFFAQNAHR